MTKASLSIVYKILAAIAAIGIITGGSYIYYFYRYKDHRIDGVLIFSQFAGWLTLTYILGGKYAMSNPIPWKKDKIACTKQRLTRVFYSLITVGLITANIFWVTSMEDNRENDIMTNQPTAFTTAYVADIKTTHSRGNTYYDAVIQYTTTDQKIIVQETSDNNGFLKIGQTYRLKYSIPYPVMFVIYGKVIDNSDEITPSSPQINNQPKR